MGHGPIVASRGVGPSYISHDPAGRGDCPHPQRRRRDSQSSGHRRTASRGTHRAPRRAPPDPPAAPAVRFRRRARLLECRPTRVATTGSAAPIASTIDSGKPSQSDGITKMSIAAEEVAEVAPRAEKVHAIRRGPESAACVSSDARRWPSPTTSRCRRARPGVDAIASNRCACAFCSVSRAMMPASGASGGTPNRARISSRVVGRRQLRPVNRVVDHIDLPRIGADLLDVEVAHRLCRARPRDRSSPISQRSALHVPADSSVRRC